MSDKLSDALTRPTPEELARRKQIARFIEAYPSIEAALQSGFTQAYVIEKLAEHGFAVKPSTFKTMLRRVRREARAGHAPAAMPLPAATGEGPPAPEETPPQPLTAKKKGEQEADYYMDLARANRYAKIINKQGKQA